MLDSNGMTLSWAKAMSGHQFSYGKCSGKKRRFTVVIVSYIQYKDT